MSWPVVKAFLDLDLFARGLHTNHVFKMILSRKDELQNEKNPEKAWPIKDTDEDAAREHRHCRAGSILLHMQVDINTYSQNDEPQNNQMNRKYLKRLSAHLQKKMPRKVREPPIPTLGPLENEHWLEAVNRCWAVWKYLQRSKNGPEWDRRFTDIDKICSGKPVLETHIPRWMQNITQKDSNGGFKQALREFKDEIKKEITEDLATIKTAFKEVLKKEAQESKRLLSQELQEFQKVIMDKLASNKSELECAIQANLLGNLANSGNLGKIESIRSNLPGNETESVGSNLPGNLGDLGDIGDTESVRSQTPNSEPRKQFRKRRISMKRKYLRKTPRSRRSTKGP